MSVLHILSGGTVGGIEVLCMEYGFRSQNENIFVLLWEKGTIAEEMKRAGLRVIMLNASKKDFVGTLRKLIGICNENNVCTAVVHHSAPMAHAYLMLLKLVFPGIKTIGYAHGHAQDMCPSNKRFLTLRKMIISKSLKKADQVIAISNSVKKSCIHYFHTPSDKIKVVYNGIDTSQYKTKTDLNIHKDLRIIYVGRLIKQKGVQNTLEALSYLPSEIQYSFLIVGDGPYRNELERIAETLQLNNISFLGERRDVPDLLQKADIFIHVPECKEGFGITVIEAMASGLVCFCGNDGALPEIIHNGEDGFLVEKDPKTIATSISNFYYLSDEEKQQLRKNSIERANDFSIDKLVNQLDIIFK